MIIDTFTAGVKPGGLNNSQHIRIMICYLIKSVPSPISREEIEEALLGEELVNYFDLASILHSLCDKKFIEEVDGKFNLLASGESIANELSGDVPLTVRETGLRAAVRAQRVSHNSTMNKAEIEELKNGCYNVHCFVIDGGEEVFRLKLFMPDLHSAKLVKKKFIDYGQAVFALTLAGITGSTRMASNAIDMLIDELQLDNDTGDKKEINLDYIE